MTKVKSSEARLLKNVDLGSAEEIRAEYEAWWLRACLPCSLACLATLGRLTCSEELN